LLEEEGENDVQEEKSEEQEPETEMKALQLTLCISGLLRNLSKCGEWWVINKLRS